MDWVTGPVSETSRSNPHTVLESSWMKSPWWIIEMKRPSSPIRAAESRFQGLISEVAIPRPPLHACYPTSSIRTTDIKSKEGVPAPNASLGIQHRVVHKIKPLDITIVLSLDLSSTPITVQNQSFFSISLLLWVTELVAHQLAEWGAKPSWHFSGVFNSMQVLPTIHMEGQAGNNIFISFLLKLTEIQPLTVGAGYSSSPYPLKEKRAEQALLVETSQLKDFTNQNLHNILVWFPFFPMSWLFLKFSKAVKPSFTNIAMWTVNRISSEQTSIYLNAYTDLTWTSDPAWLKPSLTTMISVLHSASTSLDSHQCSPRL